MTMACGYCGGLYNGSGPHYCVQGRDFLVAENKRLREALERCIKQLRSADYSIEETAKMCEEALK